MRTQQAMARLKAGVEKFQQEIFPQQRALFQRLQSGQEPLAMFITCADSRIVPNLITQTEPGEVFTERNPGNMVPPYVDFVGGVTAGVEFATRVLKVPLIVICGHTDCGVMKALLHPETTEGLPGVRQWMRHGNEARERVLRDHADEPEDAKIKWITGYNVLLQMEHVRTHPSVRERLSAGDLQILGWIYDIGTGSIGQALPGTSEFEMLGAAPAK